LHLRGGWLRRETAEAFADYAEIVTRRLGDRISWWLTHNEPWCAAYHGYAMGKHAPGGSDLGSAVVAAHHILLSHGLAMQRMRATLPSGAKVGIALNLYPVHGADDRPETLRAVVLADAFKNRWFLEPVFRGHYPDELFAFWNVDAPPVQPGDMDLIRQPIDFLGVNYYERYTVSGTDHGYDESLPNPGSDYTAMGWEVYPAGLVETLRRVNKEYSPPVMMITENGAAYPDTWDGHMPEVCDPDRTRYIRVHVAALEQSLKEGVPVQGYFAWSFLDNYEWSEGYRYRFGLVYVDFTTQRRIAKSSALWYAQYIRANSNSRH
jgi:beta-glucosidase